MNSECYESALTFLANPPEKDRLYEILVVIHSHVEWPKGRSNIQKLQKKECLKPLVSCLQRSHVGIIDITLGILVNCCMERNCARIVVRQYNLIQQLNYILKKYHKRDSIRSKVFRIIGNLCQHWELLTIDLIKVEPQLQTISKIVACLNVEHGMLGKQSEATIIMALRTLRILANIDTVNALLSLGVLNAVGLLLIKFTPCWQRTQEHEEILQAIVKLLEVYSKYPSCKLVIELQRAGNAIAHLGLLMSLSPYKIVKMITNFMQVTNSRTDLAIASISENVIQRLESSDNFNNGREDLLHREYLKCLYYLIEYPGAKEIIHNAKVILVLLAILKDCSIPTDIALRNCCLITSILNIYTPTKACLQLMLRNGIVEILSDKLDWMVGSSCKVDTSHENLGLVPCYYYPSFSQTSSSALHYGATVLDLPDYSPVCSDVECDVPYQPNAAEELETLEQENFSVDDKMEESSSSADSTNVSTSSSKKQLSNAIVNLLQAFTKIQPVTMELISCPSLLIKLLKFCLPWNKPICPPYTFLLILTIVETPEYLIELMQTNFFNTVYPFLTVQHKIDKCAGCKDLYTIGKKVLLRFIMHVKINHSHIAYQLRYADLSVKQRLVCTIPFITENKQILNEFMITCGGLNILMQLFQRNSEIQQKCITGLCIMATKLGMVMNLLIEFSSIWNNTNCPGPILLPINPQHYEVDKNCSTVVRFKLDDGSCVPANRDFLSERSEYFNRLLSGQFKESWQNEVHLHNVSGDALKLLLMLLQYDIKNYELHKLDADLNVLLEVIALTDKYLMMDLNVCLTNSIRAYKFLPTTIPTIYQWSLESRTDVFRDESVTYALVASMADSERYEMFQKLLQLEYVEYLADDICNMLTTSFNEL